MRARQPFNFGFIPARFLRLVTPTHRSVMSILSGRLVAALIAFVVVCLAQAFGPSANRDGETSGPRLHVMMFEVTPEGPDSEAILDVKNTGSRIATDCRVLWYDDGPGGTPSMSTSFALVGGAKKRVRIPGSGHASSGTRTRARLLCSNHAVTEIGFREATRSTF